MGGYQDMALAFYCGSGSPFAWKVWLTLEHKQVAYELKVLSFDRGDTKSPEFLAVNPRGQVPAIGGQSDAADGLVQHDIAQRLTVGSDRDPLYRRRSLSLHQY
jgi:glutathione S-transferase